MKFIVMAAIAIASVGLIHFPETLSASLVLFSNSQVIVYWRKPLWKSDQSAHSPHM
jgi:hypothetical protein